MAVLLWSLILIAGVAYSKVDAIGTPATIEQYPGVVQIENRVFLLWLQQCAGSVLTSYHILTAASCVTDGSGTVLLTTRRVRAGATSRGTGGVVKELQDVAVQPSYGTLGQDGDLAIVRVDSAFPLGPTIQQVPILGEGIELPAGLEVELVGWGATTQGDSSSVELHSVTLTTVYYGTCLNTYFGRETITENMLCAGLTAISGRDLDGRDAGAPFFFSSTVVGVVSFGVGSGNDTYPVVATATGSYTSWIVETASSL